MFALAFVLGVQCAAIADTWMQSGYDVGRSCKPMAGDANAFLGCVAAGCGAIHSDDKPEDYQDGMAACARKAYSFPFAPKKTACAETSVTVASVDGTASDGPDDVPDEPCAEESVEDALQNTL